MQDFRDNISEVHWSLIIVVRDSLRKPYASIICSIFPLWNQMPWRNLSWCCLKILCPYSFNDSLNCQNLLGYWAISLKVVLIFPKNFLIFRIDIIEKQGVINLSSYSKKSFASIVLCGSKFVFLEKGKDATFCPFL